jgi:hypothetical protein
MVFFQLCKKASGPHEPAFTAKTVLIYMAANNDLAPDAVNSFDEIKAASKNIRDNLLVLLKTKPGNAYLLNMKAGIADTIKVYPGQNTSDPKFLSTVINDSKEIAPSKSFGLVVWSHGTSWAPARNPIPDAIGSDEGREMNISALKNALPGKMEFILFDACSMASVEVIYELKDKADYILASPSEILSTSYPYRTIIPLLFGDVGALSQAGEKFIQYYDTLSGMNASATVSLIDTKQLTELAVLVKQLISKKRPADGFHQSNLQKITFDVGASVDGYDFLDFFDKNYSKEEYLAIQSQLEKAIVYKDHTSAFLNNPIARFSGLSIYLPRKQDPFKGFYSSLSWASASGWDILFEP